MSKQTEEETRATEHWKKIINMAFKGIEGTPENVNKLMFLVDAHAESYHTQKLQEVEDTISAHRLPEPKQEQLEYYNQAIDDVLQLITKADE